MVSSRPGLGSCSAVPESKQHAFVAAADTAPRLSRVRQRPWSCPPQQAPAAAAGRSPLGTRHRNQRLLGTTASYHSNSSDAATIGGPLDAGTMRVSRRGSGKSSSSSNNSRSSNSSGTGSRGPNVNTSRNRMMAAAKRRRWREVLDILGHWEEHAARLDAKTYNVAMSALGKCGRWKEALATLDRMRSKDVPPDIYSLNSVIAACGRAAKWKQALALLSEMEREGSRVPPDLFSYNGAISAVAKDGRWHQALDLLMGIKARGLTPDVVSYSSAMSACDRAGEWQRALEIMDLMLQQKIEPNIVSYGTAISACARGGRWQKALYLLADIPSRGLKLNAHVYGSAIHACVVGGEHGRALALLGEMLECRVVPDAAVFTVAMTAVDGWGAALRLLEVMKREGVLPNVKTYNAALKVVARSGREDVALALLNQMRIDGYSPDIVSFNTAIDACAPREKWQEAVELLEVDMPGAKVKPDVITFTSVIHACAGPTGNWEKAYELLDTMWQDSKGAKPNKRTYDLAIQACGHGGEWELGVALIDDMRDLRIKPDVQTFNIAVAACARSGERLAAETLVANMWNARVTPDEFTYASLVAACGRAKEWKRATELFDEARYVHRIHPSLQIYGALLGCLADGEQWADVLVYLDRMVTDGIVPDAEATNTAVLAAAELGDGRRALSLLEGEAAYEGLRQRKIHRQQGVARDTVEGEREGYSDDQLQQGQQQGQREAAGQTDEEGGGHWTTDSGRAEVSMEAQEEVLVLERRTGRGSAPVVGGGETREQGEGGTGGVVVRAGAGGLVVSSDRDGGAAAAAAVKGSTVAERLSRLAGKAVIVGASTDDVEAGERGRGKDNALADGVAGGGWETATPSLLNSVLHALSEAGEDAAVLEAVKRGREKGVLLNPSIYRCALKACGNLRDYNQANHLLARMAEERLTPDIVHWNHALRASAACARWEEARLRLQEMERVFDVSPDEFSYSMALKSCSAGLWSGDSWSHDNGWGAKEEGSASSSPPAQDSSRVGQWDTIRGKEQQHKGPPPSRGEHAIELLSEMREKGIHLSARSFTLAMAACLESHRDRRVQVEEAGLQDQRREGQPPAADLRLSKAALALFDQLVQAGEMPSASTYALALKACARTANPRRAHNLFWAILDTPPPLPPPAAAVRTPFSSSWSSSSLRQKGFGDDGAQPPAAAVSGTERQVPPQPQPRLEVRPWHLASAIAAFDAAGDWAGAQQLWDEALRRGVSPRSPGYAAAVSAAVRAGDTAAARRLVEEARGLRLALFWIEEDAQD